MSKRRDSVYSSGRSPHLYHVKFRDRTVESLRKNDTVFVAEILTITLPLPGALQPGAALHLHREGFRQMSGKNTGDLTDKEKIDRSAWHEEIRFLKKQQWAVATAGIVLFGGLLATIRNYHITPLDKFLAVLLVAIGACFGWWFLDDLQSGLAKVRRALDPADHEATTRGGEIVYLHKAILVASAAVVVWAVLFKLG